jgi:hypothetical protein
VAAVERRWNFLPALQRPGGHLRDRGPARSCAVSALPLLTILLLALLTPLSAQREPTPNRGTFRFSAEAGQALGALWKASVAAREERVACLASSVRHDTVFVSAVYPLEPDQADSMGISALASVEQCGPPAWSGTVHTHIALYSDNSPSSRFSAQDRVAMRLWYDRWHSDGVFCLIYSDRNAHCEADGVVGGMRSGPRIVR